MEEWYRKLDVIRAVNVGAISAAALYGRTDSGIATFKEILKAVENLPSADPEAAIVKVLKMVEEYKEKTGTDEIIIMPKNGMKAWDENGVEYTMQPTCSNLATDTISREAAIEYFVTNVGFHDEDGYSIDDSDELRKIWTEYFDGIPSAQSEERTKERTETHARD